MRKKLKRRTVRRAKSKLGLPDLQHAKSAVLVSLRSPESQRSYRRSIEDFVCWYCSEPRLSFNKTVVTRYGILDCALVLGSQPRFERERFLGSPGGRLSGVFWLKRDTNMDGCSCHKLRFKGNRSINQPNSLLHTREA
jgi:hypothetical protein